MYSRTYSNNTQRLNSIKKIQGIILCLTKFYWRKIEFYEQCNH